MTLQIFAVLFWLYLALKWPFLIIFDKLGPDFEIIGIFIISFISVNITLLIVLLKKGNISFNTLSILFCVQVFFRWVFPIVSPLLFLISTYYPEFINKVISYILFYINVILSWLGGFIPVCYMDDGSRSPSPSPFEGEELDFHLNNIEGKLASLNDRVANARPRGNIVDLLTGEEARAFLQISSVRANGSRPEFIAMRDMTENELQIANTKNTMDPNAIFIYYRNNYRPCHSYNSTYLGKALINVQNRR